nr:formate dehydrogenase-H [Raoultella sp. NCTC 9187]
MSNAITEIDNTDLVFIFGYNPADSHPIVANHVINAKRNGAKIIVCDPRKIETARIADMHIALKNGSNIALLNAIGHVIIKEDLYDKSFVASRSEGFEEYRKIVEGYTPESVEEITGVSAQEIRACARMYASAKSAAILWGMGVTQFYQGVETVRSLTSLAIMTGNLGRPSVGVNPVRGQNNVQGACDMGALPDTYPGYQYVKFPENREKFAQAWAWRACRRTPATASASCRTGRRTAKCGRPILWAKIRCRPMPSSRRCVKPLKSLSWLSCRIFS